MSALAYKYNLLTQEETQIIPDAPESTQHISASLSAQINRHLDTYFAAHKDAQPADGLYERAMSLLEKPLIEHTLYATKGNQIQAAKMLGINRNTLRKKMQQHGICSSAIRHIRKGLIYK